MRYIIKSIQKEIVSILDNKKLKITLHKNCDYLIDIQLKIK